MTFWSGLAAHYRRVFPPRPEVVAWLAGLARSAAPEGVARPAVVDLGCGVGDDAAGLAAAGLEVLALDPDAGMVAEARRLHAGVGGLVLDLAGLEDAAAALERWRSGGTRAGGEEVPVGVGSSDGQERGQEHGPALALCVGNVAAHLTLDALAAALADLRPRLAPGGRLVLQTVNFDRVLAAGGAAGRFDLPLLKDPSRDDLPALRFERAYEDLTPTACRFVTRLEADGEVVAAGDVPMVPHRAAPLAAAVEAAGFGSVELRGSLGEAPWEPTGTGPTVLLARV